MRDALCDFLFSKGYFVGQGEQRHAPATLAALAKLFNIRVVANPGWADPGMVRIAKRNLGVDVPLPFYKGFPNSVLALSMEQIVADRLLHYLRTYGLGDFSQPRYSLFEEEVVRECFDEKTEVREFTIVTEAEAIELLDNIVDSLLASTRPLNNIQYALVCAFIQDYDYEVAECGCKDTVCRLLIDKRDPSYARLLKLSDVIRLVEWLQLLSYDGASIKKLNLRNRDRKLITAVLDHLFLKGDKHSLNQRTCLEKRRLWKGLLHHLHYRPKNSAAERFLHTIRNNDERSVYSEFERAVAEGRTRNAVDVLRNNKGTGEVLRHLDYILSQSWPFGDLDYVLNNIVSANKILLIQLLYHYANGVSREPRVFAFQRLGMMHVYHEDGSQSIKRHSFLNENMATRTCLCVLSALERTCKGTLGKVYANEDMRRIGLPLQEGTSMSGVGTLPRGSRIPIPDGKKIRAFTYWERVNDIDLSAFALEEDGGQIEFSWRTLNWGGSSKGKPLVFSGDQTSGYEGGSEYFDIDFDVFRERYPNSRYIVFCDNVYSGVPFFSCVCRAGYMMRDVEDSGEVYEPATVKSSFAITCKSTFAYLFAIDLRTREIVWLNVARFGSRHVAGTTQMSFLKRYLEATSVINLYDFARMLATEVVDDPKQADVVFSDKIVPMREGADLIRSQDTERVVELLNL
ncbi:MAG: hypothetical protein IKF78_02235 [Atopobiaceae bacterium]|nr:hypothetical protein [Atopobiaceae bacterium]